MAVNFPLSVLTVSDLNFLDVSGFLISLQGDKYQRSRLRWPELLARVR